MTLWTYPDWGRVLADHPCLEEAVCMWDRDCAGDAVVPEQVHVLTNAREVDGHAPGTLTYLWTSGPTPVQWCDACRRWVDVSTGPGATRNDRACHRFSERCVTTGRAP